MFSPSPLRRTLLTVSRNTFKPSSPRSANSTYKPLINTRLFQTTAAKMGVHNIENKSEFDQIKADNDVLVVDFFATWCGPCKVISPEVVKFSDKYSGAHFVKVDVDEVPDLAQEYSIRAMPTFLLFKGGKQVQEVVGANPSALEAAIKAVL